MAPENCLSGPARSLSGVRYSDKRSWPLFGNDALCPQGFADSLGSMFGTGDVHHALKPLEAVDMKPCQVCEFSLLQARQGARSGKVASVGEG